MSGTEITITVIASVFGLVLTILNILQFFKNDKKDGKKEAQELAEMKTDLSYIKEGIKDLKAMATAQSAETTNMKIEIQKIDDKVLGFEKRIDRIEKLKLAKVAKGAIR